MIYKVLFYSGELFCCFVIAGFCFNCFSCSEDCPNRFNLNINNPTISTQQAFAAVNTKGSQQFSKGFDLSFNNPTQQAFVEVSTKDSQQFSKGCDLNFNNPTQGFDLNFKNPTQQAFPAVNANYSPQLFNGLIPNINNPTVPIQQAFGAVITTQPSNGFTLNFRYPVNSFQQNNRDTNTNNINPPLLYVRGMDIYYLNIHCR
uniref:Lipoprotein n=1 Tax=Cacopsylla melanoneura TaxID=428564 RepID=A0A8D8XHI6_9HEMI